MQDIFICWSHFRCNLRHLNKPQRELITELVYDFQYNLLEEIYILFVNICIKDETIQVEVFKFKS